MSRRSHLSLILLLAALLAAAPAASAANHTVQVQDSFFAPRDLTIAPGDTVTWTNMGSLSHNVAADNGSFRCANGCDGQGGNGSPASNGWSFTRTFDTPGDVPYHCQLHGSAGGIGMAGTVTVAGSTSSPGTVRFSSSSYNRSEGGGQATITVVREGGDDGAVSVSFATSDGSASAGSDYQAASGTINWATNEDGPKNFFVTLLDDSEVEGTETVNLALSNPGGGATLGAPSTATLSITDNDESGGGDAGSLSFTSDSFSAGEADGSANVQVARSGGTAGAVSARLSTSDGSATAGADYTPVSTDVSFGDGESGPQSVAIPLLDDATPESNEMINVSLANPTGGASLGDPSAATVTVLDDDLDTGPCVPDDTTLCLNDGRFRVQMEFRRPNDPALQPAQAVALEGVDSSGLFYFSNQRNIEMLIKVLNACVPALGNKWFVFYAATTNVEFRVTVVDTEGAVMRTYTNEQGQAAEPVQDTSAFSTCP